MSVTDVGNACLPGVRRPGMTGSSKGDVFRLGQDSKNEAAKKRQPVPGTENRNVGTALRSVYQQTIDEAVPDDLLDLLGKLT